MLNKSVKEKCKEKIEKQTEIVVYNYVSQQTSQKLYLQRHQVKHKKLKKMKFSKIFVLFIIFVIGVSLMSAEGEGKSKFFNLSIFSYYAFN